MVFSVVRTSGVSASGPFYDAFTENPFDDYKGLFISFAGLTPDEGHIEAVLIRFNRTAAARPKTSCLKTAEIAISQNLSRTAPKIALRT
jgi:hypothetical protein